MKPKNIKEAKELIERYESVTLEEIKEESKKTRWWLIARKLTGFGEAQTCTLCIAVRYPQDGGCGSRCPMCVHGYTNMMFGVSCINGPGEKTANRIDGAETPTTLRNAFRARAKYLREVLARHGE